MRCAPVNTSAELAPTPKLDYQVSQLDRPDLLVMLARPQHIYMENVTVPAYANVYTDFFIHVRVIDCYLLRYTQQSNPGRHVLNGTHTPHSFRQIQYDTLNRIMKLFAHLL